MDGTILPYNNTVVFDGQLKYNHGRVIGMTEYVMELFLNAPPLHFIGTLLYFYHHEPELENPITISANGDSITTHPGQGRLLASYFRGHDTVKSLLIPLHETQEEIDLLYDVATDITPTKYQVFEYDNQNHHGISTREFEDYFWPTDIRLEYEAEKEKLLKELILSKGRVIWKFPNRETIQVGKKKHGSITVVCNSAEGFYHSLFYLAYGHFKHSKTFSIKKI